MTRSRWLYLAQLTIGLSALAVLLLRQDMWTQVLELLSGFRWGYAPLLVAFSVLFVAISSAKWQLFLRQRGFSLSLMKLMKLYIIGSFFNNFLPSMVGGDLARSYLLGRDIKSQSRSAATVFLERFTGMIALVVLSASTVIFNPELLQQRIVLVSLSAIGGGTVVLLLLVLWPRVWQGELGGMGQVAIVARAQEILKTLHEYINEIQEQPALFRAALAYSFAFHTLAGLNAYIAALAIGASPQLLEVMTLVPLILLITSIPLTPNGIGVFEWAFSLYLIPAGLLPAQGLAVAGVIRAKNLVVSLFGAYFFLAERAPSPRQLDLTP